MSDTIAALATAPGRAALAIIRISGPAVAAIAAHVLLQPFRLRARIAQYAGIVDAQGRLLDQGLALYFQAPASATGEDVLELHTHGSPVVTELVLEAVLAAGARLAKPGEFTKRAFLAGKLDLSAAESVADLIDAEHHSAARAAAGRLAGGIAEEVGRLRTELQTLLEELAAAIDFPDEVAEPARDDVVGRLSALRASLSGIIAGGSYGRLVREGATVAIVGPPNAGKSSWLNVLLGTDRAIVSPMAGTTRDTIEEQIDCGGLLVRLVDTAGLRVSDDAVEQAGIERSRAAYESARLLVVILDASKPLDAADEAVLRETNDFDRVLLLNKADKGSAFVREDVPEDILRRGPTLAGSVNDPRTRQRLLSEIKASLIAGDVDVERPYLARVREIDAAQEAATAIDFALATLRSAEPLDLLSHDLVAAVAALGKITGETVTEDVLTGIFARFCIGK